MELRLNDPYYGSLNKGEELAFKVRVQNSDLTISRFSYSYNESLKAYVSYDQNNTTPNSTHNNYVLTRND